MRLADYDNTTSRLQRFFTVTVRPWGCLFVSIINKAASGRFKDLNDLEHLMDK
jgi:hypothetical protein